MDKWNSAANSGLRRAFETRRRLSLPRDAVLNVFDVCTQLGIEIRYLDAKSLEGMYCRDPRVSILLPSSRHRPRGRITYACAHELGHDRLGHGTRVDRYVHQGHRTSRTDPDELAADVFAAHFLMPRQAIYAAFKHRGWSIETVTADQAFRIACAFGVGYDAILTQLTIGLRVLPKNRHDQLGKVRPKELRARVWPNAGHSSLTIADDCWGSVPMDLEVGDFLAAPQNWDSQSNLIQRVGETDDAVIWLALSPGFGVMDANARRIDVRIARSGFVGSHRYRFKSEVEGDE